MCVGGLPIACDPLWQVAQDPVTTEWSNCTLVHVEVEWQESHPAVVAMWLAGLPVACVPLWQVAQEPVTLAWSKRTLVQVDVLWQLSHPALVAM